MLVATYYRPLAETPDPLLALVKSNAKRGRKGLPPVVPPWLHTLLTERTRGRAAK